MGGPGYESLSNELVDNHKLELQAEGDDLEAVIRALPLARARNILDVGCGSGALTRALARRLGPEVALHGIDLNPEHVLFARRAAEAEGLKNFSFSVADILRHPEELSAAFDLVYERYVLMYIVPQNLAEAFLSAMKRCARVGGHVVCVEADINFGQERYPPPPYPLSRVLPEVVRYYRERGLIEWRCGVQLYYHLKRANFSGAEVKLADGRVIAGGLPRELAEHDCIDVEQLIGPCLEAMNMRGAKELVARQWREYVRGSESFLYTPVFVGAGVVGQDGTA
jgi:ubiquinone/menaquinone biosynthesis C-methylase UbiE